MENLVSNPLTGLITAAIGAAVFVSGLRHKYLILPGGWLLCEGLLPFTVIGMQHELSGFTSSEFILWYYSFAILSGVFLTLSFRFKYLVHRYCPTIFLLTTALGVGFGVYLSGTVYYWDTWGKPTYEEYGLTAQYFLFWYTLFLDLFLVGCGFLYTFIEKDHGS